MISFFPRLLVLILSLLLTDVQGLSAQSLHHHMTKREIEHYFGVTDHDSVPEYEVSSLYETNEHGALLSNPLHSRDRRSSRSPNSAHYKLNAFGSKLRLKLTKNDQLMAPNLRVLRHNDDGSMTSHPAPVNTFYLGRVESDPDSTVAVSNDGGLTGMVKTFEDALFIHPLPGHLIKHLEAHEGVAPHLVYKKSTKQQNLSCYTREDRIKRSLNTQNAEYIMENPSENNRKYLEVNLIAPRSLEVKYQNERYRSVIGGVSQFLMVLANMVAGMFLDSSIGERKIIYVVTNITIVDIEKVGFAANSSQQRKLGTLFSWARGLDNNLQDYFDVFSFVSNNIRAGALASFGYMCWKLSGNVNKDVGLQTALHIAHETAHNMWVGHDNGPCGVGQYIMYGILPGGENATKWSECSRKRLQAFLADKSRSYCLDDSPVNGLPTVPPSFRDKLPGEKVDGVMQCQMQYGGTFRRFKLENCRHLHCIDNHGHWLTRYTVVADGTKCGLHKWCINGQCVNSGTGPDSLDGGWTNWSPYTPCSYPCGGGLSHRSRNCTNPRPVKGKSCLGKARHYRTCNTQPCQSGEHGPPSREMQCSLKRDGSVPFYIGSSLCSLWCRMDRIVAYFGMVKDGTRCRKDQRVYDVCIRGACKPVGCDGVLGSGTKIDRCGVCGGNGAGCTIVKSTYTGNPPIQGLSKAGLIVELPTGTTAAYFAFKKRSRNYFGVQNASGEYLVGGHLGFNQEVHVAEAKIVYRHPNKLSRDVLTISGRTNFPLRVMFIRVSGKNPGVYYYYRRIVESQAAANMMVEWVIGNWSECSRTCAVGERKRDINCIREDDKSAAACPQPVPAKVEQCNTHPCPVNWSVTYWNACSKTCGKGRQQRAVECLQQESIDVYTPADSCSPDEKPTVETVRYCNEYPCPAKWSVASWSECSTECAKGKKRRIVTCSRLNEQGIFSVLADEVCRDKEKPIAETSCNDIDSCGPRPTTCPQEHVCSNGGHCVPDPTGYKCDCALGYVGLECESQVNPCDQSPCLNGGVCSPGLINHLNYTCKCVQYFTGRNCEDGDIFPIGCFASRWGLIPELRGVGKRAIDVSNTDPAIIKCASLARNNDYSYFALGLNGRCLSSADAGTKYFKRGSTAAKKCRRGIGLTGASFVYTFETLPPFESLGCYRFKKNNKKALRTKYIDFRNQMKPENRTWTVHQCARVAHSLGHRYFGVRFFGICYTDSNAKTTYASLGKSTECVNGVGKLRAVMVYVFKS